MLKKMLWSMALFQSTPPRGGRLMLSSSARRVIVSIHAPAWGATGTSDSRTNCRQRFNPRPRVGSDIHCRRIDGGSIVSIHAPAWGATAVLPNSRAYCTYDGIFAHMAPENY